MFIVTFLFYSESSADICPSSCFTIHVLSGSLKKNGSLNYISVAFSIYGVNTPGTEICWVFFGIDIKPLSYLRIFSDYPNSVCNKDFKPNKAGLFEGSFSKGRRGVTNLTSPPSQLHISRRTYLISI